MTAWQRFQAFLDYQVELEKRMFALIADTAPTEYREMELWGKFLGVMFRRREPLRRAAAEEGPPGD